MDRVCGFSQHALGEVHTAVRVWKCVDPSLGCGPAGRAASPIVSVPSVRVREHLHLPRGTLAALPLCSGAPAGAAPEATLHFACAHPIPLHARPSAGLCILSEPASCHLWQGFPFGILIKTSRSEEPHWPWARQRASEESRVGCRGLCLLSLIHGRLSFLPGVSVLFFLTVL